MPQSFAELHVHLIFSTKHRRPYLTDLAHRQEVHRILGGILRDLVCPPVLVGGVEDHVHVLCRLARTRSQADLVKDLKRASTIWIKDHLPTLQDFSWQGGYAMFAVSHSQVPQVRDYIADQVAHHQKLTFQDEFRRLLDRHAIAYDERYLWE